MTQIGILSDTHHCWDDRYAYHFKDCDEIWHAGDIGDYSIIERLRGVAPIVRAVSGNIDYGTVKRMCPESLDFAVEGVNVFLRHIGGYPGKYAAGVPEHMRLHGTRLMVAGHSHILKVMFDPRMNVLHVNPGAAGTHGWQRVRTLVRLKIDGEEIHDLEVIELANTGPNTAKS